MSNGLFTVHSEIVCEAGQYRNMFEAGHVLRAARNTSLGGFIGACLASHGVSRVNDHEFTTHLPYRPEQLVAFPFEVSDVNYLPSVISGIHCVSRAENIEFITEIAAANGQALEEGELILEEAIFPTLLENPRNIGISSYRLDATIIVNTWRYTGRRQSNRRLVPVNPEFHEVIGTGGSNPIYSDRSYEGIAHLIDLLENKEARPIQYAGIY